MGAQGHDITGYLPRPNQAKMWSYQAMAHGCSSLLYFRYRSATKGAEQFCYGILDADNQKRRKFFEVQSFFKDVAQYDHLLQTPLKNKVCLLTDYASMASFRIQQQSVLIHYENELKKIFKPFHDGNVGVDVIPKTADFSHYQLVVVPLMIVWDEETVKSLKEYCKQGGTLVFTYRTGVKDVHNNVTFGAVLPTRLDDLVGGYVFETESLQEENCIPLQGVGELENTKGEAGIFREFIECTTAKTLYRYDDPFYDAYSAITENNYGKGRAIYMGTSLCQGDMEAFMGYLMKKCHIPTISTADGVEVVEREDSQGDSYQFIMNHTPKTQTYGAVTLEPYGSAIQKRTK